MKNKITGFILAMILLSDICFLKTEALPEKDLREAYNWYCKNTDDHKQPRIAPEFSFIKDHNGYWMDDHATDDDKVIYLTFDAGYENGNVEKILDTLKKHDAEGAFFILSNLITTDTALVKRMKEEKHLICNHTAKHKNMTKITELEAFRAELTALEKVYEEYIGGELAPFYRPPEGCFSIENLDFAKQCGYDTVFWSFAYADWDNNRQIPLEKAKEKVLSHTHNGMVILLHPTSATNAAILDSLMTQWEQDGYRFGSLYELIEK